MSIHGWLNAFGNNYSHLKVAPEERADCTEEITYTSSSLIQDASKRKQLLFHLFQKLLDLTISAFSPKREQTQWVASGSRIKSPDLSTRPVSFRFYQLEQVPGYFLQVLFPEFLARKWNVMGVFGNYLLVQNLRNKEHEYKVKPPGSNVYLQFNDTEWLEDPQLSFFSFVHIYIHDLQEEVGINIV